MHWVNEARGRAARQQRPNAFLIWRRIPRLVEEQSHLLTEDVARTFRQHGIEAGDDARRECRLFVLWSVHVGLTNLPAGLSRTLLQWLHERRIARASDIIGADDAPLYRRRKIEALYVVRNLFLETGEHGLAPPLTVRSARFFVAKAAGGEQAAPPELLADMLCLLRRASSTCAAACLGG